MKPYRLSCLPVVLAILLFTACSDSDIIPSTSRDKQDTLPLFETEVTRTTLREPVYATGTIIPDKVTDISATVSALVETVYVDVGDRVARGDPLFKLEQTDYRLKVKQLESSLALARAEFRDASADLQTNQDLAERGAVSREVFDNVKTRHEIARARMGIAEAQLAQARESLADTLVKAPFDGVISKRNIHEGAYVQARGGSVPLLQLLKIDVVAVRAYIPETALQQVNIGTPGKVTIDGLGKAWDAKVDIINDLVDERTRSIEIRLHIDNPAFEIKPGLFARVELYPPGRTTLVLDRNSVMGNRNPFVYVNAGGIARRKNVQIRQLDTSQVEIVDGLVAGQRVLHGANLARLKDDMPVRIVDDR